MVSVRNFVTALRNVTVGGFFFLMPVIVIFIVTTKAWVSLSSVGTRIAAIFGLKSIVGIGGTTIFTGLLLLAVCLACGLLVRLSFMAAFHRAVEASLAKYIPGYETYKAMAEEKLQSKRAILPYAGALVRIHDGWRPAYVIERDEAEAYVVFVPDAPDTSRGQVLLAHSDQVKILSSITANQLDAALRKLGKGLLSELRIAPR